MVVDSIVQAGHLIMILGALSICTRHVIDLIPKNQSTRIRPDPDPHPWVAPGQGSRLYGSKDWWPYLVSIA